MDSPQKRKAKNPYKNLSALPQDLLYGLSGKYILDHNNQLPPLHTPTKLTPEAIVVVYLI
jgi:hypothetical protein